MVAAAVAVFHFDNLEVHVELVLPPTLETQLERQQRYLGNYNDHLRRRAIACAPFPVIGRGRIIPSYPWAGTIVADHMPGTTARARGNKRDDAV